MRLLKYKSLMIHIPSPPGIQVATEERQKLRAVNATRPKMKSLKRNHLPTQPRELPAAYFFMAAEAQDGFLGPMISAREGLIWNACCPKAIGLLTFREVL